MSGYPKKFLAAIVPPCGNNCSFSDLETLAVNLIQFLLKDVLLPLSILGLIFVGTKLLMSAGNPKGETEAKAGLWNIFLGILFATGALVIINLIFSTLNTGVTAVPSIK